MKKTTKYFKFDYENDTTIEYVSTGMYSMLNCSYTSEDPDYGTDTVHYVVNKDISMEEIAYQMMREITQFLNKTDSGKYGEISDRHNALFGGYGKSTLYAIEHALKPIADEFKCPSWFGHLEDVSREIARRIIKDGNRTFSFCESDQTEWDSYSPEEYEMRGSEWYGIKQLNPVFDNDSCEYIVAIGYYGGGCFESAYAYDDGLNDCDTINNLGRAICNAIGRITDMGPQSVVFACEEKEEK